MVRCGHCQKELKHVTGHATIRLYRCEGCGSQQLLPGDPSAPAVAAAEPAAPIEDPISAAALLIAQNPAARPKLPPAVLFAMIALALGILALVAAR